MKILLLSDACFSDNILPLYKTMLDRGLDVTLLINLTSLNIVLFNIAERDPRQGIIKASSYKEFGFYEKYVDLSRVYLINYNIDRQHAWREISSAFTISKFIKKGRFDVIHCDFPLQRAKLLLYRFRKKLVWIQHDPFPHTGHNYSKEYKLYLSIAYRLIPKFVILNRSSYDRYCKQYNLSPNKVFTNLLGPYECINLFKSSEINERNNNVLFFGRIVKYKGIEYLCKAMEKVHEVIPSATCTIAGSGSFYFDIEPYRRLPYFEIYNRFIDESELAHLIQQCTVSVCAYTDATQSGGIITSFSLNKPVIATDLDTLKEILKDGYNCLLVPPRDSEALANAIIRLLKDENLRESIEKNIIDEGKNGKLSWSAIVDKYIEIYKA